MALKTFTLLALGMTSLVAAEENLEKNLNFAQEIVAIALDHPEAKPKGPAELLADDVLNFSKALDEISISQQDKASILEAVEFAAQKHHNQFRQNYSGTPYLNHPLDVAIVLIKEGRITDPVAIKVAILHDCLETSPESKQEIQHKFGKEVAGIVEELTIGNKISIIEKKRIELDSAQKLSKKAKLVKLADRIVNLREIKENLPPNWTAARKNAYLLLSDAILTGLRGTNSDLEGIYQKLLDEQIGKTS